MYVYILKSLLTFSCFVFIRGDADYKFDDTSSHAFNKNYKSHEKSTQKTAYNKFLIPVPYPVAVPHYIKIPIPQPYPVHVPVEHPIQIPYYKVIPKIIEKKVPYIVEKLVPYEVEKPYPVEVEKEIEIKVPKPYPVPVTIYKHVLHHVGKKKKKSSKYSIGEHEYY